MLNGGIELLLERLEADAAICIEKALSVLPQAYIGVDQSFHCVRHIIVRKRRPDDGAERRRLRGVAAEGNLVEFLALLIDAEDADVPRGDGRRR